MFLPFLLALLTVVFLNYRHKKMSIVFWLSVLFTMGVLFKQHLSLPLYLSF